MPPPKEANTLSHDRVKKDLTLFFKRSCILQKIIVNNINNRVQDFPDPITSTLILMASSPMQFVFCENGILLFKTSNLPVLPYASLNDEEREFLRNILEQVDTAHLVETYYGCGKFAVQMQVGTGNYVEKKGLLLAFVEVMQKQKDFKEASVLQRLSDIILQRFLSNISVHSDDIALVIEKIWGSAQRMHIV
jgi:hypothetical protein